MVTKKSGGAPKPAPSQDEVSAQYMKDFGLTKDEFMKVHELFSPHPVPPGLTDVQISILIHLCYERKVIRLRQEQRSSVIVPKEWSSITQHGTVRRMDHYRFKQGLVKFMEDVARYKSVRNATTKI